jgi:hypothetical protein
MATVFNDTLFGQTAFQALVELLTPLSAFSTDISSEVKSEGSAVVVPLFGNITTTTFSQSGNSGNPYEQTGGTLSAITVTLDKRKITPIDLSLQQLSESSNAGRWDKWAYQLGKSMAQTVLTDIWSLLLTTNFGAAVITTASANYTRTQLIEARRQLKISGVRGNYSFLGNSVIEGGLLGDTNIVNALNRGDNQAVKNGDLGMLFGLQTYMSDVLPSNSISLTGFACGQEAIAFAMRDLGNYLPSGDYEAVETLTDDETGITALYTRHWSRAQGKYFANLHCLYGYSTAVTGAMKLFTTPTT